MSLQDFLFGKDDEMKQISNLSPSQQKQLKKYFKNPIENNATYGAGNDYIQRILSGDPELMQQFQQPAIDQFNQEIVPGIAHRFAGFGTGAGGASSSALNNSLAQAGRQLSTDLSAQRANLQMQALPQALQYAQQPYNNRLAGINPSYQTNTYQPGTTGAFGNFASGALTAAGGPLGAMAAGGLSNAMFNKGSAAPTQYGSFGF